MTPGGHLRDEFLNHDIHHRSCGKTQEKRHVGSYETDQEDGNHGPQGLNRTRKDSVKECTGLRCAFRTQRHRDDGSLREILDGDSDCKGKGTAEGHHLTAAHPSGAGHTDSHSLRYVVEGDGKDQLCGPLQFASGAFILLTVIVEMGNDVVKQQEKEDSRPESGHDRTHRKKST